MGGSNSERGKAQNSLGMDLIFSEKWAVKVLMSKYTDKVLNTFPEELMGVLAMPAADHLFLIKGKEGVRFLHEEQAGVLHHTMT